MKKIAFILILAIALLSISAIAIFALTSDENSAPNKAPASFENVSEQENIEAVKPSAFETLSSVITSEDDAFLVAKFNQKEIFADLSRDNLRVIFAAFDVVLENNETIEIKDTLYHRFLLDEEGIEYTLTDDVNLEYIYCCVENGEEIVLNHDGKIIISTNQDSDVLKYAMLTSVYMELFPDNWTYGYTQEQVRMLNMVWFPNVMVIPDYDEYGFDNAFEAFQSYAGRTQKQFEFDSLVTIHPNNTKIYNEMSEIMENSDDPYLLELFFYKLGRSEKLNEAFSMPKITETVE